MGRRTLAWALILYGVGGIALTATGAVVGFEAAARVEQLALDADDTLASASAATRAASDSFANVDASLSNAQASATAASSLANDAAGTLRSLAIAMELSILGARPLLPLGEDFTTSADQADALADTLATVGSSLGDTRTDVTAVGAELGILADRLETLRTGDAADAPPPLRLFIGILLMLLLLPALAALAAGLALLRTPWLVVERVPVVVASPPGDPSPPA